MPTNATKLKKWIEAGHQVAGQNEDGRWKVFLFINGNGDFEGTVKNDSIKESLYDGLVNSRFTPKEINEEWSNFKIVTPAPKLLKAGTKVEILENAKEAPEFDGWNEKLKEMVGQKGLEVMTVFDSGYRIYNRDKSTWFDFPTWAVAEYFEEPKKTITLEVTAEQLKKIRKIIE